MQRQGVIGALAQNNCGAAISAGGGRRRSAARLLRDAVRRPRLDDRAAGAGRLSAGRRQRLSHAVCAHLRRLLLPDFQLDLVDAVRRRRAGLPAALPRLRGRALLPPQSRRGHRPGGGEQRAALQGHAERVPLPPRVRRDLRLPAARPELGGRPRPDQGFDRGARRHRGHRGEGEGDEPARRAGDPHRNARAAARDAKRTAPADATDTGATPDADPSKRNVRAVGPTFIPPR